MWHETTSSTSPGGPRSRGRPVFRQTVHALSRPGGSRRRFRRAIWARPGQSRGRMAAVETPMRRVSMRPWARSGVPGSGRPGGRSAEGAKGAEGGGDVLSQRGRAGPGREKEMAARVADRPACPTRHDDRVAGDGRAFGRPALPARPCRPDPVCLWLHRSFADHREKSGREGRERVPRLLLAPARAARVLAVDRHMARAGLAGHGAAERRRQGSAVQRREETVTGRMTGRLAGLDPEGPGRLRRQPPSPAKDRPQVVRPRKHRGQRPPRNRAQHVPPPLASPSA